MAPFSEEQTVPRCAGFGDTALTALIAFSAFGFTVDVSAADLDVGSQGLLKDADHFLKSDTPKLDKSLERVPLKGGVQHNVTPPPPHKLDGTAQSGTPDRTKALKAKTAQDATTLKSKIGNDLTNLLKRKPQKDKEQVLSADATSGIGIIGVKFVMAMGRPPIINRVFPGTPASEKGLRTNDIIIAVDGVPTFGLTKDEVYNMIVGTPNTPVTISVRRNQDFEVCKMLRMDFNDIKDPRVRRDYQSM